MLCYHQNTKSVIITFGLTPGCTSPLDWFNFASIISFSPQFRPFLPPYILLVSRVLTGSRFNSLAEEFSMKDLGSTRKILEIRINRERKEDVESITGQVREESAKEV